jgi:hypothetical protein
MSRGKIPVFDHVGTKLLYYETPTRAAGLLACGAACKLAENPLELRLTNAPSRKLDDGRPDRSLTVPPGGIMAAADGSLSCIAIVEAYGKEPVAVQVEKTV